MNNTSLIREQASKALLNTDSKALEEYKFKKKLLRDINTLKEQVDGLQRENAELKNRLDRIENKL